MIQLDQERLGAAVETAVRDVQAYLTPEKRLADSGVEFVTGFLLGRIVKASDTEVGE